VFFPWKLLDSVDYINCCRKNIMNDLKTKLKQCEVHHSIYFGYNRTKVKQQLQRRSSVYSLNKIEVCMDGAAVGSKDGVAVGSKDGVAVGSKDGVAVGSKDGVAVGSKDGVAGILGHASS